MKALTTTMLIITGNSSKHRILHHVTQFPLLQDRSTMMFRDAKATQVQGIASCSIAAVERRKSIPPDPRNPAWKGDFAQKLRCDDKSSYHWKPQLGTICHTAANRSGGTSSSAHAQSACIRGEQELAGPPGHT